MEHKWNIWKTLAIILAIIIIVGGAYFGYTTVKDNNDVKAKNELAVLQSAFYQQYGSQAIIKELIAPDKVYAALWVSSDNATHISWCIGGYWAEVFNTSP